MLYVAWQLDPVLLGGLVALAVSYGLMVGPLRHVLAPGEPFPRRSAIVFGLGLAAFYLVEGSPLHDLAERYLISAHMVQHVAVSYAVAPLLMAGVPAWMWRTLLLNRVTKRASSVLCKPLVCFAVFTVFFDLWHIPVVYVAVLSNTSLHHLVHLLFLGASVMLWWPILSPLEERPRLPYLVRLAYLFLIPVGQLPVFGMITFAIAPLYSSYANMPVRAFGISVMEDQVLAGVVMKVTALFAIGIPFVATFLQWYRRETGPQASGADLGFGEAATGDAASIEPVPAQV